MPVSILVVDDNPSHGVILKEVLRGLGLRPTVVDTEAAAWAALQAGLDAGKPFGLAILDVAMPPLGGFILTTRIQNQLGPDAPPLIMMLRSVGRPGDAARCRELGVAATVSQPIRPAELRQAIQTALSPPAVAAPGEQPKEKRGPVRRLLLAEDSPVNQRVARMILEKEGHTVVVAENGRQALALLEREPFDLVLMDVQMPEMGGFEATAAIREKERSTGAHIPIVALTAHAMKGDRERCLEAGMDGYLCKPLKREALLAALDDLLAERSGGVPEGAAQHASDGEVLRSEARFTRAERSGGARGGAAQHPPDKTWGREQALNRSGGDATVLGEIVALFLRDLVQVMSGIGEAIAGQDGQALERAAHRLRGSASFFEAQEVVEASARLEAIGRSRDLGEAEQWRRELETRTARLRQALSAPMEEGA